MAEQPKTGTASALAPSRVTVISVCYGSTEVLPAMIASVPDASAVILVSNSTFDADKTAQLALRLGVRLIQNATNLGFGTACNQGAAAASSEFLLFLNPDTALQPGAIDALVAAADRHPQASAFNPRLCDDHGNPQFKRRSVLMPRAETMKRGWPDRDCEVSVLSGAALMVRRADFQRIGGFDPAIFLYHEDDDLSRRLKNEIGPLMFIHGAMVRHTGGGSTRRSAESAALKAWHMGRSRVYSTRKHGVPLAAARALAAALAHLASPLTWLSQRQRAKRIAFLRGVLSER